MSQNNQAVTIKPPSFKTAVFSLKGIAPLVIHRFSAKTKNEMLQKQEIGKAAGSKKNREAKSSEDTYQDSKYVHKDGWEGINAAAFRSALIAACRLVGFKMTLAKLSFFVIPDGYDAKEPQIPLVRIYGESVRQEDMARVATGQPYVTIRAAYHDWTAKLAIQWDEDQCTFQDIANLLLRVGMQVGICEGRPGSTNSAGMGWGLFTFDNKGETNG